MNKNGLYIIIGLVFSLFAAALLIESPPPPKPVLQPVAPTTPYANLVDDESPLFLQERDVFQVGITQDGVHKILFTEMIGVGVNSPKLDKYRFSLELEDVIPGNSPLIKPKKPTIEMETLYKEKYEIPWKQTIRGDERVLSFSLKDVPAIDASEIGKCCQAATGKGCNNDCGQACSIQLEYQTEFHVRPGKYAEVSFDMTPRTLKVGKKTKVHVTMTINNKKLHNYRMAYYVPVKVYESKVTVLSPPKGFSFVKKERHVFMERVFRKMGKKSFHLDLEVTAAKKGELKIPVLFMLSGDMDSLLCKPVRVTTDRKIVKDLELSRFIWIADGLLDAV